MALLHRLGNIGNISEGTTNGSSCQSHFRYWRFCEIGLDESIDLRLIEFSLQIRLDGIIHYTVIDYAGLIDIR